MLEHKKVLYLVGRSAITSPSCTEEALIVELDWPEKSGLAAAMEKLGYELVWPRSERVPILQNESGDVVYQLDQLNPIYRRIVDKKRELVLFAKLVRAPAEAPAPALVLPQRFRDDFPVAPSFMTEALTAVSSHRVFIYQPRDLQTSPDVAQLVGDMFDRPEDEFLLYLPATAALPDAVSAAVDALEVRLSKTEMHFYRHLDPMGDDDFMQVLPTESDFEWQVRAKATQRFTRHTLTLTARKRRSLEVQLHVEEHSNRSSNPLKLEPNFMGLGLDLRKAFKWLHAWRNNRGKN